MTIVLQDGRTLMGTPLQIVREMKDLALFGSKLSVSDYVDRVIMDASLAEDVQLPRADRWASDDETARVLIDGLIEAGLAKLARA